MDCFLNCGMVSTIQRAAVVTPHPPSSNLALLFPCFLEPAFPRRCFQHLRLRAKPFLHSRKIFVQGLGTRRRGNKSHFGVEQAACCRLLCLPFQTASVLVVSRTGKPNAPCKGAGARNNLALHLVFSHQLVPPAEVDKAFSMPGWVLLLTLLSKLG